MNDVPAWQIEDLAPPKDDASREELGKRYSFIPKLMAKVPGLRDREDFDELSGAALEAYHDARQDLHVRLHGQEDIPGWRLFATTRDPSNTDEVQFAGVMDDGAVVQGYSRDLPKPTELPGLPVASVAQRGDLAQTHALATMVSQGFRKDPYGNSYAPDEVDDDLFDDWDAPTGVLHKRVEGDEKKQRPAKIFYGDWLPLGRIAPQVAKFAMGRTDHLTKQVDRVFKDNGVDEHSRRHFGAILGRTAARVEMSRHGVLASRMMASINPETRELANSTTHFNADYLNWLTGIRGEASASDMPPARREQAGPVGQVDPNLGARRRKFTRDFPVLAGGVALAYFIERKEPGYAGPPGVAAAAVDAGYPMKKVLVDLYQDKGMTEAHTAHLQGVTWQRAGREAFKHPDTFLGDIAKTPAHILPKKRPDYAAWRSVVGQAKILDNNSSRSAASFLEETRGNYEKYRLEEREDGLTFQDVSEHVRKQLLVPARYRAALELGIPRGEALEISFDALYARMDSDHTDPALDGHTLATARSMIDRVPEGAIPTLWSGREDRDVEIPNLPQSWSPLLGKGASENGKWQEMTSVSDLRAMQEDQELYGRYQGTFRTGFGIQEFETLVFSFESSDNQKSALVFKFDSEPGRSLGALPFEQKAGWTGEPVLGKGQEPTPASRALWQEVVDQVSRTSSDRFAEYGSGLMESMTDYREAQIESGMGFRISDDEAFKKSWDKNSSMLAPSLRVLGPDALVARERTALMSKKPRQGQIRPTELQRD